MIHSCLVCACTYGVCTCVHSSRLPPRSPPSSPPSSHVRTPAVPSFRWPYAPPRSIRRNLLALANGSRFATIDWIREWIVRRFPIAAFEPGSAEPFCFATQTAWKIQKPGEQAWECWCHACVRAASVWISVGRGPRFESRCSLVARHGPAVALGFWQPSGGYRRLRQRCSHQWIEKFGKQLLAQFSVAVFSSLWPVGQRSFRPDVWERSAEALAYSDAGQVTQQRFWLCSSFWIAASDVLDPGGSFPCGWQCGRGWCGCVVARVGVVRAVPGGAKEHSHRRWSLGMGWDQGYMMLPVGCSFGNSRCLH